jgi:hypothetical protein
LGEGKALGGSSSEKWEGIGMKARILLCLVTILSGSCGHGPDAHRIRPDTNDAYYPQREIHFVEHGRRSRGVLVAATKGFDSAFQASWVTVLVPLAPGKLEGPAWTGRAVGGDRACAIAALPQHRDAIYLARHGDLGRFRFREPAAWVLGTDPYILGLPAGKPQLNWRDFALKTTGVTRPQVNTPLDMWLARFVVEEELSQPLARLVVYPDGFWKAEEAGRTEGLEVTVVTLPAPLPIDQALDALASGDPLRLGATQGVTLDEKFASDAEQGRAQREDQQRVLADAP